MSSMEENAAHSSSRASRGTGDGSSYDSDAMRSLLRTQEGAIAKKDRAIDELNDTVAAFKLLQEKQLAELNAKDLLLARKQERIDELAAQLKERDERINARDREITRLLTTIQSRENDLQELREQLDKDEDEFSMLHAAMEAKEQQMAAKKGELTEAKEIERKLENDVDRLQVIIRRWEKASEDQARKQADVADACLSPRSFHENQLIQLRDDALEAKTKEIWLITGQNHKLRAQLDELDAELERLQTSFVSKENDVVRRDRQIEKLMTEIDALQVSRQQADGREMAIEIATTQNAKLLQALQTQETAIEDLRHRLDDSEQEREKLRQTNRQFLEESAEKEVDIIHKTREVEHKSSTVTMLQDKISRERKELHRELAEERMKYQIEVEKLQSELVMRRNKQYELTMRLQEAEAKLHQSTDDLESATEQLLATRCRMDEAERVLHDSLQWKKSLEENLSTCKQDVERREAEQAKTTQVTEAEILTLKTQVTELKDKLVSALDREKRSDYRLMELKQLSDTKENMLREQKERISRLVRSAASESQSRAECALEKEQLSDQLSQVRQQMEASIRISFEQNNKLQERYKKLQDTYRQLEAELRKVQASKSKLVVKFVETYAATATFTTENSNSLSLNLRECSLADHDLEPIFSLCGGPKICAHLARLDLRGNRLTQHGMSTVMNYFQRRLKTKPVVSHSCSPRESDNTCIRELDLRDNFISIDGIRILASGLETLSIAACPRESQTIGIKSVSVKDSGLIECYRDTSELPLLTVDITSNSDAIDQFVFAEGGRKTLPGRRRRQACDGGIERNSDTRDIREEVEVKLDGSSTSSRAKDALEEIYGLDLVSAHMGPPRSTGRRKCATDKQKPSESYMSSDNKHSDNCRPEIDHGHEQDKFGQQEMLYREESSPWVTRSFAQSANGVNRFDAVQGGTIRGSRPSSPSLMQSNSISQVTQHAQGSRHLSGASSLPKI